MKYLTVIYYGNAFRWLFLQIKTVQILLQFVFVFTFSDLSFFTSCSANLHLCFHQSQNDLTFWKLLIKIEEYFQICISVCNTAVGGARGSQTCIFVYVLYINACFLEMIWAGLQQRVCDKLEVEKWGQGKRIQIREPYHLIQWLWLNGSLLQLPWDQDERGDGADHMYQKGGSLPSHQNGGINHTSFCGRH